MIITGVVSALALGASLKVYRNNKSTREKREMPWTVAAERMAKNELPKKRRRRLRFGESAGLSEHLSSSISKVQAISWKAQEIMAQIVGDTRRQQVQEITVSKEEAAELSDEEKELNRNLLLLFVALGFTAGGAWLYPPLTLIGLPFYLYSAVPMIMSDFYTAAVKEKRVSMAALELTLIGLMLGTGHFFAATLGGFLYLFSKKLVLATEDHSRKSLINIFGQQERMVWVKIDAHEIKAPLEQLKAGDIVVVNTSEMIPVDGIITSGMAGVDQHILTGEAQPVEKEAGDRVFASTVVLTGRIEIEVEKTGSETTAAQIGEILLRTADFKMTMHSRGVQIADRTALPTLSIGGLAFLSGFTPIRVASLMNANFGYNMRVLAPIAMLNYLNLLSQQGILVKDGRAVELLKQVDTVVFDKTGTLTEEVPHVAQIHTCSCVSADELLTLAAAAEYKQKHPIALAILQKAKQEGLTLPAISDAVYKVGYGLTVTIDDKLVRVGSPRFIQREGIAIPPHIQAVQEDGHRQGHSFVMVAINEQLAGALELHATVRKEAKAVISQLRQRGIQSMYIISGDHEAPTQKLAKELGISDYFACVLPEDKADLIKQLQAQGKYVCYIGDGINDSIALKQAHVSISLRGASTIATDTAAIILMDGNLSQLGLLFDIAEQFSNNLRRTLMITILPGFVSMSGVLFLHFGIITTILLNQVALAAGMANTMLPFVKRATTKGYFPLGVDAKDPHPPTAGASP